eukprot:530363-Pyramimonas_sp.AAC.1
MDDTTPRHAQSMGISARRGASREGGAADTFAGPRRRGFGPEAFFSHRWLKDWVLRDGDPRDRKGSG